MESFDSCCSGHTVLTPFTWRGNRGIRQLNFLHGETRGAEPRTTFTDKAGWH